MNIVHVTGVWDARWKTPLWSNITAAMRREFPDDEIRVERRYLSPWKPDATLMFAAELLERYDTGEDFVGVGHSMGGVILAAIAPRFRRSRVRLIVTIFSPHETYRGKFPRELGVDYEALARIPVISFGARIDTLVPYGARCPVARYHEDIWSDHLLRLMFSKKLAARIARIAKHHIERPAP